MELGVLSLGSDNRSFRILRNKSGSAPLRFGSARNCGRDNI